MDKLAALRIYATVYLAKATQFTTSRYAREWMEMADFRAATRKELEKHAGTAAAWANLGYTPQGAAPLIADGITPAMVAETEQHAADAVGGHEALAALRIAELTGTGQLIGDDRIIRVIDPIDPTREIIAVRDDQD